MSEFEILHRNRDKQSGELLSFLVMDGGKPVTKKATPENVLLYEHGMRDFLEGQHALKISERNPELMLAPMDNEKTFMLRVNGETVETTPKHAEDVLRGLKDIVEADTSQDRERGTSRLVDVYDNVRKTQVRKWLVNSMLKTFDEPHRIQSTGRGWLIDDFYLVDWSANVYTKDDDPDEGDYKRSGGSVQQVDTSYEFVQLSLSHSPEPVDVRINGDDYRLSEREMLFLSKAKWLLARREYHPDEPFWKYNDKVAGIEDAAEDSDEVSLGKFNL